MPGTLALLDQLDRRLPLDVVLTAQTNRIIGTRPLDQMDVADLREQARARLLGTGLPRNCERALYWATLGAAAMDRESLSTLAELDTPSASRSDEGARTWSEIRQKTAQSALEA